MEKKENFFLFDLFFLLNLIFNMQKIFLLTKICKMAPTSHILIMLSYVEEE